MSSNANYEIFSEVLDKLSLREIAEKLSLHLGTLKRWVEKRSVPKYYLSDLNSLLNNKYTIEETFRNRDQFYTNEDIARYCYEKTLKILIEGMIDVEGYFFIEPSAGIGSFYNLLPRNRRIGIDIEKTNNAEFLCENYLNFLPDQTKKYIVIGNPPFGLRGNLALRFINHSLKFADIVAFILPPLFNSTGKGVPMKRVKGYNLVYSEKLPMDSFHYPDGTPVSIATIFQIWSKVHQYKNSNIIQSTCKKFIKVYSLSDGGTPGSTRNKDMIDKCDVYLPSTCFQGMKAYKNFEDLPNRRGYGVVFFNNHLDLDNLFYNKINWSDVAFVSTNGALNLRMDLIENELIKNGYYDA